MSQSEILIAVAAGKLTVADAQRLLTPQRPLYRKVSEKGGVSVYGLQRMPVTLYVEQWHRLLDFAQQLKDFLTEHDSELKRKDKAAA